MNSAQNVLSLSKVAAVQYIKLEQVKHSVTDDWTKIRRTALSYFRYG